MKAIFGYITGKPLPELELAPYTSAISTCYSGNGFIYASL